MIETSKITSSPLGQIDKVKPELQTPTRPDIKDAGHFDEVLKGLQGKPATEDLKFSAHAKARLQSRSIELSADDLVKMKEAVGRAREKGSKESLILTDDAAFVVSVKNNTVITAVDRKSLKDNVFTNIDSTVMI